METSITASVLLWPFDDDSLRVGWVRLRGRTSLCVFNWDEAPRDLTVKLPGPCEVSDLWNGANLGRHKEAVELIGMSAHSPRLLRCEPVSARST